MGNIRGIHTSPGTYTRFRDISKKKKNVNVSIKTLGSGNSGGGGGGDMPITTVWVFGDKFPIVFSSYQP